MNPCDELVPLTADATRARRHPWALAGLWVWQTVLAIGASWPAAALVGGTYAVGPRGDAPLWDPGGHALLDLLWHNARGLGPVAAAGEAAILIGAIAGLVPTGGAMFAMAYTTTDSRAAGFVRSMTAALRAMPSLLLLLVVVSVAQAVAGGIGFLVSAAVETWAHSGLGEARAQRMAVAVALVFVALVSGLGVVHDLARAVVMRSRASGLRALLIGAQTFGRAPLPLWWSWAWRSLVSTAPVLAAAMVASRIGGRGGVALLLLAIIHQVVVLSRVVLHASWLAHALRSVDVPIAYRDDNDR